MGDETGDMMYEVVPADKVEERCRLVGIEACVGEQTGEDKVAQVLGCSGDGLQVESVRSGENCVWSLVPIDFGRTLAVQVVDDVSE